jgi:flagellar FliL protein
MVQKILIFLNLIVALVSAGVVFYAHNVIKPVPIDQKAEAQALKDNAANNRNIHPTLIKKFAVNLYSQGTRLRYLDLEMNILTFEESQKAIIKSNEHLFKDIVIETASQLSPDDLDPITGKILFENKIKQQINAKIGDPPVVKKIYFSVFVVQ